MIACPVRTVILFISICYAITLTSYAALKLVHNDDFELALLFLWGASPTLAAIATALISLTINTPTSTATLTTAGPTQRVRSRLLQYALSIGVGSFVALFQYATTVHFGLVGAYRPAFVASIRRVVHCADMSEAASAMVASVYEHFVGVWWDPLVPENADWKIHPTLPGGCWMFLSLLEETGWTAALFPAVMAATHNDRARSALITGLVWSSWHFPFILDRTLPASAVYYPGTADTPLLFSLITFTIALTSARVVLIQLCAQFADSLFVAIVFHAAHNLMIFSFFAQIVDADNSKYPLAPYFVSESGIVTAAVYALIAIVIIWQWNTERTRRQKSQ